VVEIYNSFKSPLLSQNIQNIPGCKVNTSPSFMGGHYKSKLKSNHFAFLDIEGLNGHLKLLMGIGRNSRFTPLQFTEAVTY